MRSPDLSLPAWDKMPDWNQDLARKGREWWNTFGLRKWLNQSLESDWSHENKSWNFESTNILCLSLKVSSNSINLCTADRIRISVHWRKLHFFPPDRCLQRPMRGCFCWNYLGPLALSCFHLMDLSAALFQTCEFSSPNFVRCTHATCFVDIVFILKQGSFDVAGDWQEWPILATLPCGW